MELAAAEKEKTNCPGASIHSEIREIEKDSKASVIDFQGRPIRVFEKNEKYFGYFSSSSIETMLFYFVTAIGLTLFLGAILWGMAR